MKSGIAISLIFFACSVRANDVCRLTTSRAEKVIKVNGVPGFFFKVHPNGDKLTYIHDTNRLLDLNIGKDLPTVGNVDPVWSPDGKFLTYPGDEIIAHHGDEIIRATEAQDLGSSRPFKLGLMGTYQSIGIKDGKYKMISDHQGISMINFEFGAEGPKSQSSVTEPCSNIQGMATDLPMLSKDGRFLSVYDSETSSTKIYRLDGSSCELALDLGFSTGKVSFNSDSSQIAFHVDQFSEFDSGYFSGVGKDKIKNVVVMNLLEKERKLAPSSWGLASHNVEPGDGGYYPDFDKHGNLYFLEDIGNNFQFVKVNQSQLDFKPLEEELFMDRATCEDCDKKDSPKPTSILAKMWIEACAKVNPIQLDRHPILVAAIDPVACRKMVEDFWVPSLGVSKVELLRSCPKKSTQAAEVIGEWDKNQKNNAEKIISARCISCHTQPREYQKEIELTVNLGPHTKVSEKIKINKKMPSIDLEKMDYRLAAEMIYSINDYSMPKLDPLNQSEQTTVISYLKKRMLDMESDEFTSYFEVNRYTEENLEIERENALENLGEITPENREIIIKSINCLFGQKDCEEYLAHEKKNIVYEASELPESEKSKFIEDKIMEIRCRNHIGVTFQQCYDHLNAK